MRLRFLPLLVLAAFVPACGKSSPATPPTPDVGAGFNELAEVYKYRASQRLPPPAKPEDLTDHEDALPNAIQPVRDGQIVVVWRVGYSPGSNGVLAYQKDAPANGGKVLLRNGTVKDMTAEEFRAAKRG
jgi:hypothetical protein